MNTYEITVILLHGGHRFEWLPTWRVEATYAAKAAETAGETIREFYPTVVFTVRAQNVGVYGDSAGRDYYPVTS
jgi:hypothetical protein